MKKKMYLAIVGWIAVLVLVLALAGCGKITDIAEDQQENDTAESAAVEAEESADQPEIAAPETEDASEMNSDGKYVYQIDGHELSLSIRLEDFIDGDVLDWKGLRNALGYTEGIIRDSDGNVIAETGGPDKTTPIAQLFFIMGSMNSDQRIYYHVTAMNDTDSKVLTLNTTKAQKLTFNQVVVAAYLWEYYNDGEMHEDPLADVLVEYRHTLGNDRNIAYQIP